MTSGETQLLGAQAQDAAEAAWRELEAAVPEVPLPASWSWTAAWLRIYGPGVEHWFVVSRRAGRTAGVALLARERPRVPWERGTIHVGTAGEPGRESVVVERNALLAAPGERDALVEAILAALPELPRHRGLALDGFVPEDAEALCAAAGLPVRTVGCPYRDLAQVRADGGDVLAALRSGVRSRVRQSMRAAGTVDVEWAATPERAADVLEELIALHTQRWRAAGEPGAFAQPRFAAFHRDVAPRLAAEGRAMLFRARAGGTTVGCLYGFVDRGELLFYQSGFSASGDNRLRPGLLTHVLAMQACSDRGLDVYDFLAGEARYKDELSSDRRDIVTTGPPLSRIHRALRWAARRAPRRRA